MTTSFGPVAIGCSGLISKHMDGTSHTALLDESEDRMKAGMSAWLICSTICIISLAYGQLAMSAYFLALSCVVPGYVAKQLRMRSRL